MNVDNYQLDGDTRYFAWIGSSGYVRNGGVDFFIGQSFLEYYVSSSDFEDCDC